jgi:DNA-directed RNA polymerase subunit RPC12/RpoP
LTIREFNAAASAYQRWLIAVVVAPLLTLVACFAVVLSFRDTLRAYYTREFGAPAAEVLIGLTPVPAVLVLFALLWIHERRIKRDGRLRCPHCRKLLVGMDRLVVATRNCGHCGNRVLTEPRTLAEANPRYE